MGVINFSGKFKDVEVEHVCPAQHTGASGLGNCQCEDKNEHF